MSQFPPAKGPVSYLGYTVPPRYRPQWYVGNLVFRGGVQLNRTVSLTGSGQIYGREYKAYFQPVLKTYSGPVTSITGGGQIVARPAFLQALFGGAAGNSG